MIALTRDHGSRQAMNRLAAIDGVGSAPCLDCVGRRNPSTVTLRVSSLVRHGSGPSADTKRHGMNEESFGRSIPHSPRRHSRRFPIPHFRDIPCPAKAGFRVR